MLKLPNTIKMLITDFDGVMTDNYAKKRWDKYINNIRRKEPCY